MVYKVLAFVLALLGYYFSPYGPHTSPNAEATQHTQQKGGFYLAKVSRVADGDTLTVRNRDGATHKVRLHAVDAPELKQAGGEQSHDWLSEQVLNKEVKIVVNNTDRYKRQVAKVILPQEGCEQRMCEGEIDINLLAIEAGHAWWYRDYSRSQSSEERQLYETAEDQARQQRKGLWQRTAPQAPWQWRMEQRNQR